MVQCKISEMVLSLHMHKCLKEEFCARLMVDSNLVRG